VSDAVSEPQAADQPAAEQRGTSWVDRFLAVYPLGATFVLVSGLLLYQAWQHSTPAIFGDELKWAELARSLAHTGHAMIREGPASIGSLYTVLMAPAWWLGDTQPSYAAAKAIGTLTMVSAMMPTYFLARLVVGRPLALFAAAGSATVPGMVYGAMLIPEPLAYFWSALTVFLVAKALATRSRWWIGLACASLLVAPLVRSQLTVLIAAAAVALVVFVATGTRGRRTIGGWSLGERIGVGALIVGFAIVCDAWLKHHSYSWQIGTYFSDRMLTLGVWAAAAFAIGIGIFPAVTSLAWLLGGWRSVREPGERALYGVLAGAVLGFGLYTAVKASFISTNFARRVEERNLIYLSPLVFVVTAYWLARLRMSLVAIAIATVAIAYTLVVSPYEMDQHFYSDAPGLTILGAANRTWFWNEGYAQNVLLAITIFSAAVLAGFELVRRYRSGLIARGRVYVAGGLAVLCVAMLAWNVTAEVSAARASNDFSDGFSGRLLADPPDWVDHVTGGAEALYLGQKIADPNPLWLLEFWNRSVKRVWSLDATAPPPGPVTTPDLLGPDGQLYPPLKVGWAVADNGVHFVGTPVKVFQSFVLYKLAPPLRIRDAADGVFTDGWMGRDSSFAQYSSPGKPAGTAVVTIPRAGFCPDQSRHVPSGRVTIRLGDVKVVKRRPMLGRVRETRRLTIPNCTGPISVRIPARTPFRVDTRVTPTFRPSAYGSTDVRDLGAQVSYAFKPR